MKLTVGEINERVSHTDAERSRYRVLAQRWEEMWGLKLYKGKTAEDRIREKGEEQVLLPEPYNLVGLARRLMATEPKIEVPSLDMKVDRDDRAENIEHWLSAFIELSNREQERIIVADAVWQQLVRGRAAFQVQWVKDALPYQVAQSHLPILVRTPDPLNIGVSRNHAYTEYAYHKYYDRRDAVLRRYPKLRRGLENYSELGFVQVTDFWYRGKKGEIWNAILVENEFAKEPARTDYPDIPIIEVMGDSAPAAEEHMRGLSLLFPIEDLWKYYCRLSSTLGTAVLHYAWPALIWKGPGMPPDIGSIGPGSIISVPTDGAFEPLRMDMNQPLVQSMMQLVGQSMSKSTFPDVMYGDSGNMQAGYGVNILADQARGRIQMFLANMEMGLSKLFAMVLAIVESMADEDEGVSVWGRDSVNGRMFTRTIKPSIIKGNYSNIVTLKPNVPADDIQAETIGLQKVQAGIISKRTFRDRISSMALPHDEDGRILIEQARTTPEVATRLSALAIVEAYPDNEWIELIQGTPMEQQLPLKYQERIMKWRDKQEQRAMEKGIPLPGMMPPGGDPSMMGPPMGPEGMMPPGMDPSMMGPPPEQGGMPSPDQLAQALLKGEIDPGMVPPEILMQLAEMGLIPPEMAAGVQNMQPPQAVQGVPPAMQGQMTPQMMGITPQMMQENPALFQQMTGQPMTSAEELDRLLGLPGKGKKD